MIKKKGMVLDCSITMSWLLVEDAFTEQADAILAQLVEGFAMVPTIWPLEVANVLCMSVRRKKITANDAEKFIQFLSSLPIRVDQETSASAMDSLYTLAMAETLTVYDAAYLELAI